MKPKQAKPVEITREEFPMLTEFARGYLHQEVVVEYGSTSAAASDYIEDLEYDERKQLAKEVEGFREATRGHSHSETNKALQLLGSAWEFPAERDLGAMLDKLRGK